MIVQNSVKALALGALVSFALCGGASAKGHAPSGHGTGSRHGGTAVAGRGHGGGSGSFMVGYAQGRHGGRHGARSYGSFNRFNAVASGYSGHSGGIQCVTFARADSGIELSGNANTWWDHAEGVYQRGNRPEPGSVLNFRANGSMRMGHVAVVNQVLDGRTVEIDHANWGGPGAVRGGISRAIRVVDVSPNNDWSAVRVGLGHSGDFGSIYPTFGFIYNRPDSGTMMASNGRGAPMPDLNPAPRDLRPASYDEVAEAPEDDAPHYRRSRGHRAGRAFAHGYGHGRTYASHAGHALFGHAVASRGGHHAPAGGGVRIQTVSFVTHSSGNGHRHHR